MNSIQKSQNFKNWPLLFGAIVSLVAFILLTFIASQPYTAAQETQWLWQIHQLQSPLLTHISVALAWLGGLPALTLSGALLTGILLKKQRPDLALFSVISISGAVILGWSFKWIFARPRPEVWTDLVSHYGSSFPSGHSLYALTLAGVFVIVFYQSRWWGWILGLAALWSCCMGLSRVYLGAHFPTDVLAGWALGLAWLCGLNWFLKQFDFFKYNQRK